MNELSSESWKKPQVGWIKLNCDDAWRVKERKAAIRVIVRDDQGRMVAGTGREVQAYDAEVAEVMAVKEAMKLAKRKGFLENRGGN